MRPIIASIAFAALGLTMVFPAGARAQDDFANPELCRGSNIVQAVRDLAASGERGSLTLPAPDGSPAKSVTVDYERCPETVRLTAAGSSIPTVTLAAQVDDSVTRTWPAVVSWPGGELTVKASFSTATLRLESRGNYEPYVVVPKDPFWMRIEGRGSVPRDVAEVVRSMVAAINTGPDGCLASGSWCAKYALRAAGNGFICGISFGTDEIACGDAHDAHCSWCDCKGFNCPGC
jgi:hypothetical protein